MGPKPISWPPSQYWDGAAGKWSSFALRVGKPEQTVRVIPSTAGISTWVVAPAGCLDGEPGSSTSSTCIESRGGLFSPTQSRSWEELGNNSLGIDANLGYGDLAGLYGLDTIELGFSDSIGGPKLDSQVVTSIVPDYYYVGLFGLNHQATNLTNFTDPHPSALSTLKKRNLIPSLSWAYTAGAPYRSKGVFGSLTFGGYDSSRFVSNDLSLNLAPDITRDLVVGLYAITSTTVNHSNTSLLPSPILAFIDSTQPNFYLPIKSCQAFESAFRLVYNQTAEKYLVDDALHRTLLSMNPNITFTIGNLAIGGPSVDIVLPYASFDLQVIYPLVPSPTRYFPLKRAANDSQYTLGRTFMQEAYVITDYERSIFSVSQARFEEGITEKLVTIHSTTTSSTHVNSKAIIGTAIGAATLMVLIIFAVAFLLIKRRRRTSEKIDANPAAYPLDLKTHTICSVREIDNNSTVGEIRELPNNEKYELQDEQSPSGSGNKISEMANALQPVAYELRTQRSSMEKLMMEANRSSTYKIFKSTKISRKSQSSVGSVGGTLCVETVISVSSQQSMSQSPTASSRARSEIYASYIRKSPDLDRSLPPTPISESPMVSPVTPRFKKSTFFRRWPQRVERPPRLSTSTFNSPRNIISKYSKTVVGSEPMPRTPSLTGMESVIPPPDRSNSDLSEMSALSEQEQIEKTYWI